MSVTYRQIGLAGGSLLTSRLLLTGALKDYPLSLLLAHLAVAQGVQWRTAARKIKPKATGTSLPCAQLGALWFVAITLLSCICLISAYKTLRFAGSLPTAALLLSLHFSATLSKGSALSTAEQSVIGASRLAIFTGGFTLVLLWDYRLNITSRDMSIAFLASSHVLIRIPAIATSLENRIRMPWFLKTSYRPIDVRYLSPSIMVPLTVLAYLDEGSKPFVGTMSVTNCTILLVNFIFIAACHWISCNTAASNILAINALVSPWSETGLNQNAWTALAFSGFASFGSLLLPDDSAMLSPWQCMGYLAALAASQNLSSEIKAPEYLATKTRALLEAQVILPQGYHDLEMNSSTIESPKSHISGGRTLYRTIACAATFWSIFAYALAFRSASSSHAAVNISTPISSSTDFDIVVAAYDRAGHEIAQDINSILSLSALQNHTIRTYIYNKGSHMPLLEERVQKYLHKSTALYMKQLDNEGREGGTYLHHIVSQWQDLARHTLFIQEQAHDFALIKQRIGDYLVPETGFMSLSYEGKIWKQCDHLRAGTWPGITESIHRVASMMNSTDECQDLVMTFRGQFLASSARIRSNSKVFYAELLEDLVDPTSWMHTPALLQSPWLGAESDSLVDPVFGYTLERLWGVLMRCSKTDIAGRSPSLLGSYIRSIWFGQKVAMEDVQCLDHDSKDKY